MRGTAVLALPLVLVVMVVALPLPHAALGAGAVGDGGGEGGCERRCGRMKLPYPFGFSSGCTIQLGCNDTDDVAWLGHARDLGLFVRNVTARAITLGLSPDCSRQFNSSVTALFSDNYPPSDWNNLLGRSCSPAAHAAYINNSCIVPPERYKRWPHCTTDETFICIGHRPPNTSGSHFINRNELLGLKCTELVSSFIMLSTYEGASLPALMLDALKLDWWVQGQCRCSSHANCTAFTAPTTGQEAFRCECWEGFEGDGFIDGIGCLGGPKKTRKNIYIIASTSSILALCLAFTCLLGYKAYRSRKRSNAAGLSRSYKRIESFLQKNAAVYPKRYTYAEVKKMTGTFAEKLGQGGFGVVYRGGLSSGRQIAVKMLKDSKSDVEEFINEVASISTTSHVNVVTVLGFCLDGSKRALIYDYMPNGSLERYAFKHNSKGENTLSWEKLFDSSWYCSRTSISPPRMQYSYRAF